MDKDFNRAICILLRNIAVLLGNLKLQMIIWDRKMVEPENCPRKLYYPGIQIAKTVFNYES